MVNEMKQPPIARKQTNSLESRIPLTSRQIINVANRQYQKPKTLKQLNLAKNYIYAFVVFCTNLLID